MKIEAERFGFVQERQVELKELSGVLYEMTHEKTGLKLAWLKRDEENKTFGIAFETLPWDDTGVFHILEHSVLCGSEKYPVKEPFVELLKSSLNTFLNAMTYPDKTVYPVCSRNDKDFLNLTRVYLDAVFRPAIYEKPEIFHQEGWHYEFDGEGKPSYKGVVFNEMKGAFADADRITWTQLQRALFPDNAYGFVSGGDPAKIPDLSYEKFLEAHRKFYSPSNAYVFLDGALDINAVLELLDRDYLAGAEKTERIAPPAMQKPINGGTVCTTYEIGADEKEEGKTRLAWGRVVGTFADREKLTAVEALSKVLCGGNHAPLSKLVLSEGLAEDVNLFVYDGVSQPWVILEVKNLKAEDAGKVEEKLFGELRRLAEEGLDHGQLEAILANMEFQLRERDYGYAPTGLVFGLGMMDSWLYGGKPEANLEVNDLFEGLRKKLSEGYFEKLIREVLLENSHCCKVVLTPSKTAGEERNRLEAERLEKEAAAWTEEKKALLKAEQEKLESWQHSEDTPEQLATLPHLALSDLDDKPEELPLEKTEFAGVPVLKHELATNGIVYTTLYFDAEDCSEEELSALHFLCRILGKVRTKNRSVEQLTDRVRLICGDLSFDVTVYGQENDGCGIKFTVFYSALEKKLPEATELVAEILTETVFDQENTVLDLLRQEKTQNLEGIVMGGHQIALCRVGAQLFAHRVAQECVDGFTAYQWLKDTEANWDWNAVKEKLTGLLFRLVCRKRLTVSVTGNGDFAKIPAEQFATLPEGTAAGVCGLKPWGVSKEIIVIPADIAFASRGGDLGDYSGQMALAGKIVSLAYLWNVIRVQGGAYGTGLLVRDSGFAGFYSYRDPNGAGSLEKYAGSGDFLRQFAAGDPDLTGFIIGTVSDATPLMTPRVKGKTADSYYWKGISYEKRCEFWKELLTASAEDLKAFSDRLDRAIAAGGSCVVAGQNQVEKIEADRTFSV